VEEEFWFKTFDLGRDAATERRSIESGDPVNERSPGSEVSPEGFSADSVRGNDAEAGNDDATTTRCQHRSAPLSQGETLAASWRANGTLAVRQPE